MKNKKGLSDIVTNVLIILLVLVAVGIIWAFLRPTIQQGAGGLAGATDCLTVDVEPVSCVQTGFGDQTVTIKRNVGSGALMDVKILFRDDSGNSKVVDASSTTYTVDPSDIDELGSAVYVASATQIGFKPSSVSLAASVDSGDGTSKTCAEGTVKVSCT